MSAPVCQSDRNGFTLVETLIALSVFAIIAVAASTSLSVAIGAKDQAETVSDKLVSLSVARSIIRNDFSQIVRRSVRDPYGGNSGITFEGGALDDQKALVRLVRRGWVNPGARETRGDLQYVEYRFEGGQLIRRIRRRIDAGPETPVYDQVLLSDLEDASIEFLVGRNWQQSWRLRGGAVANLPSAVSIETTSAEHGSLQHLFLVSGERPQ